MALARCSLHPPQSGKQSYIRNVPAAGKGLVCGSDRCSNDALVWLTSSESAEYERGETIFSPPTAAAKFRVARIS